jgi:hypothetical protein
MSVLRKTTQTLSDIVLKVPLSRAVPKLVLSALYGTYWSGQNAVEARDVELGFGQTDHTEFG